MQLVLDVQWTEWEVQPLIRKKIQEEELITAERETKFIIYYKKTPLIMGFFLKL